VIPTFVLRQLLTSIQVAEFYFVRYGLALLCALSQTIFYQAITLTLNGRIGFFFLLATVTTPGNFHASVAYLPSSFAMYAVMVGAASFMNWRGGLKTSQGVFWFAVAGVLGWPFASALCAPFILEEVVLGLFSDTERLIESAIRISRGVVAGLLVVVSSP
jgi:alpha-1,2-mannosyltransferase